MESETKITSGTMEEDSAIRAILEGTSSTTGSDFFSALVKNLCEILKTKGAWATEYFEELRVLKAHAFIYNNRWINNFEYKIDGTPCEQVIEKSRFVHIRENVSGLFPNSKNFGINVVSYMGVPLLDTTGKTLGLLAVIDDEPMPEKSISVAIFKIFAAKASAELQRLMAEKQIEEKEKKLRRLINGAMDGIIELDGNFVITFINPAGLKLFNCELEEIIGKSFLNFLSEYGNKLFEKALKELERMPEGEKYFWITDSLNIKCKNGIGFPSDATLSQYKMNGDIYYTVILRNTNDKLEAENKIRSLEIKTEYLTEELRQLNNFDEIIGKSKPIMELFREINLIAKTESTVLIFGETGTGKELVARTIHSSGSRRKNQLIKVNCSAIPSSLIESEFFGHVQGAFTGATKRRIGRFELADGGTIFLDEIGDLEPDLQSKLLRVIQEGEFEPVGSSETKKINVRIIAATNRDLLKEIKEGRFREDLYYRLNVYPITVPPLRERRGDILLLAEEFIKRSSRILAVEKPGLPKSAADRLLSYNWPGNVRELQNVIERAIITSKNGSLNLDNILPPAVDSGKESFTIEMNDDRILSKEDLFSLEKQNIIRALKKTNWKISGENGAALLLGIPPTTLNSKIKIMGISKENC